MSDSLSLFLIDVAQDPARLGRFLADPDSFLAATGLSEDEKAVVKGGDPAELRRLLAAKSGGMMAQTDDVNFRKKKPPVKRKYPQKKKRPTRKAPSRKKSRR